MSAPYCMTRADKWWTAAAAAAFAALLIFAFTYGAP